MPDTSELARKDRQSPWLSLDCLVITVLAIVSTYNFVRRGPTAFEWPGTDMACFYERLADPSFLPNDYYTNSIVKSNPRHVFGYLVVGAARLFGTDWYSVYFVLRVVQTVAIPGLWYLAMGGLLKPYLTEDRQRFVARMLLGLAVVLVMRRDVSAWFSIAWWPPYFQYVGAHPLAIMIGLVGIVVRTSTSGPLRHLSLLFWFAASLIHPAIGIFMVAFYLLCRIPVLSWQEGSASLLLGGILPAALLTIWYRPSAPLPSDRFVDLYVFSSHPFHYQLSEFASLTRYPWWVSFAIVLGLLVAAAVLGLARRRRLLTMLGLGFAVAYGASVALQYVGTEVWPSRLIAALGPSRFSFLGYFMVAMCATLAACDSRLWETRWHTAWHALLPRLTSFRPRIVAAGVLLATLAVTALYKDDIQRDVRAKHGGLYDWIERSTRPEDVFLPTFNHALHKQLPVIGRRALFASQTFPFREEAIPEHIRRLTIAYGSPDEVAGYPGRDQIVRRTNYFRSLTPDDVVAIAGQARLDYIIVETSHSSQFAKCNPAYADDSVAVYRVRDLEILANQAPRPNPVPIVTASEAPGSALQ